MKQVLAKNGPTEKSPTKNVLAVIIPQDNFPTKNGLIKYEIQIRNCPTKNDSTKNGPTMKILPRNCSNKE
jgi:hypothetical protein